METLLQKGLAALGYGLVEWSLSSGTLRVCIEGPQEVGVDDCAHASRHLMRFLAVEAPEFEWRRLEVSSPGERRRLRHLEDCGRFLGKRARLRLVRPKEGRRQFTGAIEAVEADTVAIAGESLWRFSWNEIEEARLWP